MKRFLSGGFNKGGHRKDPELVEVAKEVLIDPSGSKGKAVRIGTMLSSE